MMMKIEDVEAQHPDVGLAVVEFMYLQGSPRSDPDNPEMVIRAPREDLDTRTAEEVAQELAALDEFEDDDAHARHIGLMKFLTAADLDVKGMAESTRELVYSGDEDRPQEWGEKHRDEDWFKWLAQHLINQSWAAMPDPEVDPAFFDPTNGVAHGGSPGSGMPDGVEFNTDSQFVGEPIDEQQSGNPAVSMEHLVNGLLLALPALGRGVQFVRQLFGGESQRVQRYRDSVQRPQFVMIGDMVLRQRASRRPATAISVGATGIQSVRVVRPDSEKPFLLEVKVARLENTDSGVLKTVIDTFYTTGGTTYHTALVALEAALDALNSGRSMVHGGWYKEASDGFAVTAAMVGDPEFMGALVGNPESNEVAIQLPPAFHGVPEPIGEGDYVPGPVATDVSHQIQQPEEPTGEEGAETTETPTAPTKGLRPGNAGE